METYFTKKEVKEMMANLTRQNKKLTKQVDKLTQQVKELKADYAALLETVTEHVTE